MKTTIKESIEAVQTSTYFLEKAIYGEASESALSKEGYERTIKIVFALQDAITRLEGLEKLLPEFLKVCNNPIEAWALEEYWRLQKGSGHEEFKKDDTGDLMRFRDLQSKLKELL